MTILAKLDWWERSRSGVALVLVDPDTHATRVDIQRRENERRDAATPFLLGVALMAYIEGRYNYARQMFGDRVTYMVENLIADESHPSYTEMRNFLIGELDARYIDACRAAFWRVEHNNRWIVAGWREVRQAWSGSYSRGERGWL